jgi:hypothetical protein
MADDGTIDYAEHLAHDCRTAREQESDRMSAADPAGVGR